MTIEQLAEIGHEAYRKSYGNVSISWAQASDLLKKATVNQTTAIAREVLGPVTSDEYAYVGNDAQAIMAHRLTQLTNETSPVAQESAPELANPDDAEVERVRVAKAMFDKDAKQCGWVVPWDGQSQTTKDAYLQSADAAISAMGGGKRWGIEATSTVTKKRCFTAITIAGDTSTCDMALCDSVCAELNSDNAIQSGEFTYKVREYPSPPAVPDAAVEAGAMALAMSNRVTIPVGVSVMDAMKEVDPKPWMKHAELCLTAALPHLQKGAER